MALAENPQLSHYVYGIGKKGLAILKPCLTEQDHKRIVEKINQEKETRSND